LLEGGLTLRFAVADSQFTLDNVGPVYTPQAVSVAGHFGVAVRLW
jgi:hypothetical protein